MYKYKKFIASILMCCTEMVVIINKSMHQKTRRDLKNSRVKGKLEKISDKQKIGI